MLEFLYPTQADNQREWFHSMLLDWQQSGKPYLCFPFFKFRPHTLPKNTEFWMYMYYRVRDTDLVHLKGVIKFRIHVMRCVDYAISKEDTHLQDFGGGETIWFHCNKAEEIRKPSGTFLTISDFEHTEAKNLSSTMRTSIPPIKCIASDIQSIHQFP
jgi:hypothetical protein